KIGNVHTCCEQINAHNDAWLWTIAKLADVLEWPLNFPRNLLHKGITAPEDITPDLDQLISMRGVRQIIRQLLQTVQVVAPELVHSRFQSPYPFSFFWQVSNRFLVACHRRLFRISETRKLDVGDAMITSWTLQHAFVRESLFAFAYPPTVLAGELQNSPIRIPRIQSLLPDSRFWWTLSRSAPWSQCSTHPLAPTFIISPQVLAAQAFAPEIFGQFIFRSFATPTSTPKDHCSVISRGSGGFGGGSLGVKHPLSGKSHQRRSSGFRGKRPGPSCCFPSFF